ncbi:DUF2255 family protein [Herbidospora galbida]|uniref:DUF2255 family protein n=1 Tax=Herbidospora galbida TaxID=2575442 RepID=A0A4U3MQY4_9ACTN|nr:DUF2255 family protein [Herbidospora galbida]TKK90516.1 DUF2255 family protein [Herbidospora galbida]
MTWTQAELSAIGEAEELEISPRRADGSYVKPVTVWVVRHDDDLYVRSYKGEDGRWFRAACERSEGHVTAGGVSKDVSFVLEDDSMVNDGIDLAYRMKYRDQDTAYVDPMVASPAKETTIRLVPR